MQFPCTSEYISPTRRAKDVVQKLKKLLLARAARDVSYRARTSGNLDSPTASATPEGYNTLINSFKGTGLTCDHKYFVSLFKLG